MVQGMGSRPGFLDKDASLGRTRSRDFWLVLSRDGGIEVPYIIPLKGIYIYIYVYIYIYIESEGPNSLIPY